MIAWVRQQIQHQASTWRGSIALGGSLTLCLRLFLGLLMAAVWLLAGRWLQPALLDVYTGQIGLDLPSGPLAQAFMRVWLRWDAIHYLRLAEFGYHGAGVGSSAFYPLFPFLIGALARITGLSVLTASLLLSSLLCWATLSLLHRLVSTQLEPQPAFWATAALAAFPTSFFLLGPFTESLFLALTLGALLAAYQKRWLAAALLAALASLTRGPGLLTAVPIAWIGWHAWTRHPTPRLFRSLLPVGSASLAAIIPGFLFQYWRQTQGFPGLNETLRLYSRQEFVGPLRGTLLALDQLLAGMEFLPLLEFLAVLLFALLTLYLILDPQLRRPEWILFQAANLVLFISFNAFEASAWRSMARYVLSLFPGFIAFGYWLSRQRTTVRFALMSVSAALLFLFSGLFTLFWFFG